MQKITGASPGNKNGREYICLFINGKLFTNGGCVFFGTNFDGIYRQRFIDSLGQFGGYDFAVRGVDFRNTCKITAITLGLDSIRPAEGIKFILQSKKNGQGWAQYEYSDCDTTHVRIITSDLVTGQLSFTRFDAVNRIASGDFWFNVLDKIGDTIKITNGRFDINFIE